ncbi:sn-glycerol-3-phosphate ABC transporter ATP-binding protein UgpC [Metarhizobium album]|uniref:sn-glycerol-3-phosphate ABC transporter ATP-binding protein UgpC n=1 Tax=Metarhizobium album TaxID=2182425 RepID=A0A2U2DK32_9HYPH|nr:sn-glycerol-3-phosphate ABC transporter ATP-binding protein UgpC [Rhizobium album]PWE53658.1 sn-glycerol-3-phosphate ABC transporter ATP-binding protein UgpC [Rhizobium album]
MNAVDTAIHVAAKSIRLADVTKAYGKVNVIPSLDIEFRSGEFTVILGPSGCGKSTLLQMIAGLERVTNGKILFGGKEVQDLEPKQRGCAMVFQNYALYPHMTVAENMSYSLKVAGMTKPERQARVKIVAGMLGLGDYLDRKPGQLSGGQRQRVAIGRAIIREPGVLLFDEPLSNLDAQLRHDTRIELADLHRRIGATTVFVTHDQVEAMTLADRILILNKGQVEQFDTPKAIYHRPASVFVAKFIGSPPMNILPAQGDGSVLRLSDGQVVGEYGLKGDFQLGIRPENVVVEQGMSGGLAAPVRFREDLGSHSIISVDIAGTPVRIATPFGGVVPDYTRLAVTFPMKALHLFDGQTGKAIPEGFGVASKDGK